jgi:hypothetical protein
MESEICKCGHLHKVHGDMWLRSVPKVKGLSQTDGGCYQLSSKSYSIAPKVRAIQHYDCPCTKFELDNLTYIERLAKEKNLL